MLSLHYFASIRERLDKDSEEIELPASVSTVEDLIAHLRRTDPALDALFTANNKILVAVNQTVVSRDHQLAAGDEVAFFPPMTGG